MNKRVICFDWLRIISAVAVIIIHISGSELFNYKIGTDAWNMHNLLDSLCRFAVPVFIMISGALFLPPEKNINLRKLFSKNLVRIITAFLFWSVVYACVKYDGDMKAFLKSVILGHHHMYFLYVIAGLYISVPILRKICEEERTTRYFLVLAIIFAFLIPTLARLPGMSLLSDMKNKLSLDIACGYSAYFVAGHYLSHVELSKRSRMLIYALGTVGFLATFILTKAFSEHANTVYDGFYNGFSLNVMLQSVAVFVFARYNLGGCPKGDKSKKLLYAFSDITFGVYLVHMLVIDFIDVSGVLSVISNPFLYAMLKIILTVILSGVISYVLNRIPYLKKYIV